MLSEFLEYIEGDTKNGKQDCELKAFKRLAERLKKEFPRLPIIILLDGLYPNGPVVELILKYNWQGMIVLQDKSLSSVWDEVRGLGPLQPKNHRSHKWGDRRQLFRWVNDIEYEYCSNGKKKKITLHVVICEEEWEKVDESGKVVTKSSRHVWISSLPLDRYNVHERCNLGARHRWGIEIQILVEKRHGFQYEHCFSYDWNAMKGYHFLMHLARLFIILACYSKALSKKFFQMGVQDFLSFIRETCAASLLIPKEVEERLKRPFQLRLE